MFFTEMEFRQLAHPISAGVCPRCGGRVERCDLGVRLATGPPPPRKPALGKTLGPGALHPLPHASRGAFRMRDSGLSMAGVRDLAWAGMPDRHSAIIDARKPASASARQISRPDMRAHPRPCPGDGAGGAMSGLAAPPMVRMPRLAADRGRRSIIMGPGPLSGSDLPSRWTRVFPSRSTTPPMSKNRNELRWARTETTARHGRVCREDGEAQGSREMKRAQVECARLVSQHRWLLSR